MATSARFMIPDGSNVDLSVTQNGITAAGQQADWGGGTLGSWATEITDNIDATATTFAPMMVVFTTDASIADKEILGQMWSFGDPGLGSKLHSSRAQGRDLNVAEGHSVAHCFTGPGDYTVTVYMVLWTLLGGLEFLTLTKVVTIGDPDVVFPGANTIVVDQAGLYTGKPSGAQEALTIEAGVVLLKANGGGRLMLKAGDSYAPTATLAIQGDNWLGEFAKHTVLITSYGPGADPVWDATQFNIDITRQRNVGTTMAVENIDFLGGYDVQTGTGNVYKGAMLGVSGYASEGIYTFHNIKTRKCYTSVGSTFWPNDGSVVFNRYIGVSQCDFSEWEFYGIYSGDANISIVGNKIKQATNVVKGDEGKIVPSGFPSSRAGGFNLADHGPVRIARCKKAQVHDNDIFTNSGWSPAASYTADQPGIRCNTSSTVDAEYNISRNTIEGGWKILNLNSENNDEPLTPYKICTVRGNHFIGTAGTRFFITAGQGNVIIENNIGVMPNVATDLQEFERWISHDIDARVQLAGNAAGKRRVVNNTFIDLRSTANQSQDGIIHDAAAWTSLGWDDSEIGNNLVHAPNRTVPIIDHAPLSDTSTFPPLYEGQRWKSTTPSANSTPALQSTGTFQQQAGSSANAGGTDTLAAVADFTGAVRQTATPSLGAFENAA